AKNRREVWLIAGYGTPLRANATARPIPLTASHCTGSEHTSRVVRPRTTPTTTGSSIPALALVRLCPSVGTVGSECDGARGEEVRFERWLDMREAAMQRAYLEFDECEQDGVGAERS
ncbi:uncharacterized protein SCHCODRAFT_02510717, partial [Schizophyllum commune H4-8]|uniref:uncharacterized protein n=1 Tax=Schizophyllum commune (strain H4-8 / FGSC 9210) TaxID=578458 RepID=UPI00215FD565